jgi:hypothetical protein
VAEGLAEAPRQEGGFLAVAVVLAVAVRGTCRPWACRPRIRLARVWPALEPLPRIGMPRIGTARTGTARTGTARTGTARTGTARTGNSRIGASRVPVAWRRVIRRVGQPAAFGRGFAPQASAIGRGAVGPAVVGGSGHAVRGRSRPGGWPDVTLCGGWPGVPRRARWPGIPGRLGRLRLTPGPRIPRAPGRRGVPRRRGRWRVPAGDRPPRPRLPVRVPRVRVPTVPVTRMFVTSGFASRVVVPGVRVPRGPARGVLIPRFGAS